MTTVHVIKLAACDAVLATRLLAMPAVVAATTGWWRVQKITTCWAITAASIGLSLTVIATSASAVILYRTGNPTANTTAPTGALANSGWRHEGQFRDFLGTTIAANYFITAKHIGGSVGQSFVLNGISYTTTAVFPDPSSDLQIWQVSGTFPT